MTTSKHYHQDMKNWIKELHRIGDGSKDDREMFRDFCEMAYCAYAKSTAPDVERQEALEARYMKIVGSYKSPDTVRAFPKLMAMAFTAVSMHGIDFLGVIAGEIGVLNERMGQFFTPIEVSRMMSQMLWSESVEARIEKNGYVTVGEPAAGSGGMLLTFAEQVERAGYDPTIHMLAEATELNKLSYHMCFLQLTWAGIPAQVVHGNSLSLERFDSAWTPPSRIFLDYHGHLFEEKDVIQPKQVYQEPVQQLLLGAKS